MTRHVPWDPWPDVRWGSLVVVSGLVLEVPEGWTTRSVGAGVVLDRADGAVSIAFRASGEPLADDLRRVPADAIFLEASTDRLLVALPSVDDVVIRDERLVADRGVQARISLECSVHDWPATSQIVDGLLDSRWHQAVDRPVVAIPGVVGVDRSRPSLQWTAHPDVLDHLARFRDRGMVRGSARRSEAGVSARELGFVGRLGGVTEKGDEVLGPVLDHDAMLVVDASDPAVDGSTSRWGCWVQGRRCVVRASRGDGTDTLGIVDVGSVAAHLLGWLDLDPVGSVGAGEPVTISSAQYEDRSGPCPSDVEWFRTAWAAPAWRFVNGWSHEAGAGVGALLVPGVGNVRWSRDDDEITLQPIRNAALVRSVVEVANSLAAGTGSRSRE
jgi:hypothetical protein